ncbi:hypothetical protein JKP88DRAFT_205766 [Tribonema minus]|uniref:DNA mismatch repair protein Mlh3 n=1 Tax=Tribonema minus TaxID=303371 RepID=A0A835ZBI9_9STRA|nr:hypothetical protein JKP88DRAFT_205766 [Tribonema minus]
MVRQCGSYGTNAAPVRGVIPSTIHHILKYKACHGAIRFGDLLSQEQCCELVHGLSQCRLPFQCAHGRPSMVPLAHMQLYAPGQT